jgi:hypothetical protein
MIAQFLPLVREKRSIVAGAAIKIASFEAATSVTLTDKERAAMAGSREFWDANGEEINELVDQLSQLEAA